MLLRPESCRACQLDTRATGFVPPSGPASAVAFIAEAAGHHEAINAFPLHPLGESGGMFARILAMAGYERNDFRVSNCISCQPPKNALDGMPWEQPALRHCRPNLDQALSHNPRVVVALGGSATRELLALPRDGFLLKDWHGTVNRGVLADGSPAPWWVVPTFHPAHITRGAHSLIGTMLFDIRLALKVAELGWLGEPIDLQVNPPVEYFRYWAEEYKRALALDPARTWLAVDIETAEKRATADESELKPSTAIDATIEQVNFAYSRDQGITVPCIGPYMPIIAEILALEGVKVFWYRKFDIDRLRRQFIVRGVCLDGMWAWHWLQSDLPRGLGFVAPYYSGFGAWKHLSSSQPGPYAAIDPAQTLRCVFGIAEQLQAAGRWEGFWRHGHLVDEYLFWPACEEGLLIDRRKLEEEYKPEIDAAVQKHWLEIQESAPEAIRPLHPKDGWKSDPGEEVANPEADEKHPGARTLLPVMREEREAAVLVCLTCGAEQLRSPKHRCKDSTTGKPVKGENPARVEKVTRRVARWFVRREFNPGSWQQVLAAIEYWKHAPGKNKKTGGPSTDRLTLERLSKHAKPEGTRGFYRAILSYREVKKVKSAYVDATLARLDANPRKDNRLRGEATHRPSTLRSSWMNPNLQNVVARGHLAAGFRACIVAGEE